MPSLPDAIILCGGAGLRLREVTRNAPKAMAKIGDRPFLELLFRQLRRNGYERAILAVGYQKDAILDHFRDQACGLRLVYSPEAFPLGTGGALRNAADLIQSNVALVMNGDSYMDADLGAFVAYHRASEAAASVVVASADGRGDCGNVYLRENGEISRFEEKQGPSTTGYLNAGIYLVSTPILYEIPAGLKVSLETELFPRWLAEGRSIGAFVCRAECLDIGTPERYRKAQENLACAEIEAEFLNSENRL